MTHIVDGRLFYIPEDYIGHIHCCVKSYFLRAFASILTIAGTHGDVESVVHNEVNSPQFRSLVADVIES